MTKKCDQRDFLQSKAWLSFQSAFGRKTFEVIDNEFSASLVEHELPLVGKYLYSPRGPFISPDGEGISNFKFRISNEKQKDKMKNGIEKMVQSARKNGARWIRIEPQNEEALEFIKQNISEKNLLAGGQVVKAPHDTQPRETFVIDISKSEEQLLAEMKPKTRYNINLARKKAVIVREISNFKFQISHKIENPNDAYVEAFLRLTREMADRQGIATHPEAYYRTMIKALPEEMLHIYVAEYDGKIIAANLVVFYGDTATYLHGASSNEHRNVMAPFLLQWRAILDAKQRGCARYDMGGVKTIQDTKYKIQDTKSWAGITQFKTGFSPNTKPVVFPGSYDIIIKSRAYALYRGLQKLKAFAKKISR